MIPIANGRYLGDDMLEENQVPTLLGIPLTVVMSGPHGDCSVCLTSADDPETELLQLSVDASGGCWRALARERGGDGEAGHTNSPQNE
jgi:hypothetical protein